MNEASIKADVMQHLKRSLPSACALRHEDMFRAGVPDISVTYGSTRWLEVKYLRPHETASAFRKHFDQVQLATCVWLGTQGQCDYFLAYGSRKNKKAFIVKPDVVKRALDGGAGGPGALDGWAGGDFEMVLEAYVDVLEIEAARWRKLREQ